MLGNWGYYRALVFSAALCLLLMFWVRYCSVRLDRGCPWHINGSARAKKQALWGFLLPLAFAVVGAWCYFLLLQIHILHTVYFKRYFPIIVLLLLLLNSFNAIWALLFNRRQYVNKRLLALTYGVLPGTDMAIVYRTNGEVFYHDFQGRRFAHFGSLKSTYANLPNTDYFLIRREVLVARKAIQQVVESGATLKLILAYEVPVDLSVSHRNLVDFKHWLVDVD